MSGIALVIGKFMPFHRGHQALIDWTLERADEVIVLVGALPGEPIPGPQRWEWLSRHYRFEARVRVEYTDKALPTAPEPDAEVSRVWGLYLKERFPEADWLSSSEGYGPLVAAVMGVGYQAFDSARVMVPISANQIRLDPWAHWSELPEVVQPYYRRKICLVGPEGTGKTTLARQLGQHFETPWIPEAARGLIDQAGGFSASLLAQIVWNHEAAVREGLAKARRWLFVDTDFITTQFYARKFLGEEAAPPLSPLLASTHRYDLYLYCEPDIPYELDPQRAPQDRRREDGLELKKLYRSAGIPLHTVTGRDGARLSSALRLLSAETW